DDSLRHRNALARSAQHVEAVHVAQAQVDEHAVRRLLGELGERVGPAGRRLDVVAGTLQHHAERAPDETLVVDDQDGLPHYTSARGSTTSTAAPRPFCGRTSI